MWPWVVGHLPTLVFYKQSKGYLLHDVGVKSSLLCTVCVNNGYPQFTCRQSNPLYHRDSTVHMHVANEVISKQGGVAALKWGGAGRILSSLRPGPKISATYLLPVERTYKVRRK